MFIFNSSIATISIVNIFWTDDSLVLVKENFFFCFQTKPIPSWRPPRTGCPWRALRRSGCSSTESCSPTSRPANLPADPEDLSEAILNTHLNALANTVLASGKVLFLRLGYARLDQVRLVKSFCLELNSDYSLFCS